LSTPALGVSNKDEKDVTGYYKAACDPLIIVRNSGKYYRRGMCRQ